VTHRRIEAAAQALSNLRQRPCLLLCTGLDRNIAYRLHSLVRTATGDGLDIVLCSLGGDLEAAYLVVRQLRKRFKELTGFVPFYAKSAATLVALGMDNLVLGEFGELGPLDTQLDESQPGEKPSPKSALNRFKAIEQAHYKALEFFNIATSLILRQAGVNIPDAVNMAIPMTKAVSDPLLSQIDPHKLGESARALDVGNRYAMRVLKEYRGWEHERASEVVDQLVNGYPSHGFIIDREELGRLKLESREPNEQEAPIMEELFEALLESVMNGSLPKNVILELLSPRSGEATQEVAAGKE